MEIIGQGGECYVWRTNDGIFKEYHSKSEAKEAFYWQSELARHDLAPEVYSRVKRIRINREYENELSGWGYYTEEAETFSEEEIDLYNENYISKPETDDVDNMVMALFNVEYTDFHLANYGYVQRNGRKVLVILDTTGRSFEPLEEMEAA